LVLQLWTRRPKGGRQILNPVTFASYNIFFFKTCTNRKDICTTLLEFVMGYKTNASRKCPWTSLMKCHLSKLSWNIWWSSNASHYLGFGEIPLSMGHKIESNKDYWNGFNWCDLVRMWNVGKEIQSLAFYIQRSFVVCMLLRDQHQILLLTSLPHMWFCSLQILGLNRVVVLRLPTLYLGEF
jgi:hypothetical protein